MFDFERAKQKFDSQSSRLKTPQLFNKHSSNSKNLSNKSRSNNSTGQHQQQQHHHQHQQQQQHDSLGSGIGGGVGSNGNGSDIPFSKQNFNETVQFFDENVHKYKRDSACSKGGGGGNSLNLDGLKVSEDDDVSSFI